MARFDLGLSFPDTAYTSGTRVNCDHRRQTVISENILGTPYMR